MGTARIRVALSTEGGDRSYEILIHPGMLDELAGGTVHLPPATSFFIVTDSNVARIYAERLLSGLARHAGRAETITFPAGESSKNFDTAWKVASELSRLGADRSSLLLALGGGVVGDLTGFVASIYKRGIAYVQIPTTLLAQVDSSIGGKTGLNAPWGKNQIGTFYQPRAVLTDPLALSTLPSREMLNGLAEIVKCAVVADRGMFERLSDLQGFDSGVPEEFIIEACKIKAAIVSEDEKEENLRAVLNYGHTVGHAIESASAYETSHGICVVLGMLAESWISFHLGILPKSDFDEQSTFLLRLTENLRFPRSFDKKALFKFALADKKASSSTIRMSLPEKLGKMYTTPDGSYRIPVNKELFMDSIDYLRRVLIVHAMPPT